MHIKEYEALTLKECLQQVRSDLGPDAVILETRKVRRGGLLGFGSHEAVCIVAATGITVKSDVATKTGAAAEAYRTGTTVTESSVGNAAGPRTFPSERPGETSYVDSVRSHDGRPTSPPARPTSGVVAARSAYLRAGGSAANNTARRDAPILAAGPMPEAGSTEKTAPLDRGRPVERLRSRSDSTDDVREITKRLPDLVQNSEESKRYHFIEQSMREIRESLSSLQKEQRETHDRTVTAVVSAVAPAVHAVHTATQLVSLTEAAIPCPELRARLISAGVNEALATDLVNSLPDVSAWSEPAQLPMAIAALRDLISRRVCSSGPIALTTGHLKAVALIGPTGVGKTTTIAKLAAHFALVEQRKVALLTVDTYRIAAVEQLKIYSSIIDIPVSVAYSAAEVPAIIDRFADYDLLLIDTAGRSQKNIMQVGELKNLLETVQCETHLVLSASTKESDMLEAANRFSGARVDRLLFSKLDETSTYGTLLNVANQTGIPLSYLTTGQKVPEDLDLATGSNLASMLLA